MIWTWIDPETGRTVRSDNPPSKVDSRFGDNSFRNKLRGERRRIGRNLERLDERRAAHGTAAYHTDNDDTDA